MPQAEVPDAPQFRRDDVYEPKVAGRERRRGLRGGVARLSRRMLTSRPERQEHELEVGLRSAPRARRSNVVAVVSPKGGVGKTTCTFLVGNLLAAALDVRVVAVDANRDFGTLASLVPDDLRVRRSQADLLASLDRVDSVSALRGYVSALPTGLHVLAASDEAEVMATMTPAAYGALMDLLTRYYELILLDLGTGIVDPLAQFGIERADQVVLVTTPEYVTTDKVLGALPYLNGGPDPSDPERDGRPLGRLTVVLNRATAQGSADKRVMDAAFRRFGISRHVVIPDDDRLHRMLDSATYALDDLYRPTRVPINQLGLAVAQRLV